MANEEQPRQYDLEDRTYEFARDVRAFVRELPHTVANIEDVKQLVRASGSVGANYIEANEALGKKDFVMHVKICRKEAREPILPPAGLHGRQERCGKGAFGLGPGSHGTDEHLRLHRAKERVKPDVIHLPPRQPTARLFRHLDLEHSDLLRISDFGFRI